MIDPDLCTPSAYFTDLRHRMRAAGISANRLARACHPPMARSQITRWMRQELDPRLSSVGRLEAALTSLLHDRP